MGRPCKINAVNSRSYLFVITDENERVFYRKLRGRRHLLMKALFDLYPNYSSIECYVLSNVTLSASELLYRQMLSDYPL